MTLWDLGGLDGSVDKGHTRSWRGRTQGRRARRREPHWRKICRRKRRSKGTRLWGGLGRRWDMKLGWFGATPETAGELAEEGLGHGRRLHGDGVNGDRRLQSSRTGFCTGRLERGSRRDTIDISTHTFAAASRSTGCSSYTRAATNARPPVKPSSSTWSTLQRTRATNRDTTSTRFSPDDTGSLVGLFSAHETGLVTPPESDGEPTSCKVEHGETSVCLMRDRR